MNITKTSLKAGDAGVLQTFQLMQSYVNEYAVNPQIKKIISDIQAIMDDRFTFAKKCEERFKLIELIFIYIVHNMKYVSDPEGVELVKSAKHTILGDQKYGDCDDLSVALATLLKAAGFNVWFRAVAWKRETGDAFTHVFCMVELPCGKKIMPLDACLHLQGFGNMVQFFRKQDFAV